MGEGGRQEKRKVCQHTWKSRGKLCMPMTPRASLSPSLPYLDVEEGALGAGRAGGGVEVETDATAGLQVPGHALEARGLGREGRRGGREGRRGGKDEC